MTTILLTIEDLEVSPLNVRNCREDAEATAALEASILQRGLLQQLLVHPPRDDQVRDDLARDDLAHGCSELYGVFAGGRRLRAIIRLIDRGDLPPDWPISCELHPDLSAAEIRELSLSENLLRRDLRGWEVHLAIATMAEEGLDPEEIAAHTGQRPDWVRQQLRLGRLAPPIFAAYVDGEIPFEEARAYAATADQALQSAAFDHFKGEPRWHNTPDHIRAWYRIGDRELGRMLAFVGRNEYEAAGGHFETDLFDTADDRRGRIVDETLLRQIAEDRRAGFIADVRAATGRPDLRFQDKPPQFGGHDDHNLELHDIAADDIPVEGVIATVEYDEHGLPRARYWWESRTAKGQSGSAGGTAAEAAREPDGLVPAGGEAIGQADGLYSAEARRIVRDEHGLTADGLQVVRSLRRQLLRAMLVRDSHQGGVVAREYLVWSQCRMALGDDGPPATGARKINNEYTASNDAEPTAQVSDWLSEQPAYAYWDAALEDIAGEPFMQLEDPAESFAAFLAASQETRRIAAALVAGLSLVRSLASPGWRVPAHDRLADSLGATDRTLRGAFTPTARFLGLFSKLKRLELAQPFVDTGILPAWAKQKDKPLTAAVTAALDPDNHAGGSPRRAAAESWIHPLLGFGVTARAGEDGPQTPIDRAASTARPLAEPVA